MGKMLLLFLSDGNAGWKAGAGARAEIAGAPSRLHMPRGSPRDRFAAAGAGGDDKRRREPGF
jgi:hypothetical protein